MLSKILFEELPIFGLNATIWAIEHWNIIMGISFINVLLFIWHFDSILFSKVLRYLWLRYLKYFITHNLISYQPIGKKSMAIQIRVRGATVAFLLP